MTELLLVVRIEGRRVAMRATDVHSVIELESLAAVPRTPAHVAGLSALRSRVLTVIDSRSALDLPTACGGSSPLHAAVVEIEGHLYALQVDAVEDVVAARSACTPLRARLGAGWDRTALGMIESDSGPLLLLDVARIVSGPEVISSIKVA